MMVMTEQNKKQLYSLLSEYAQEMNEGCRYNCDNCNLGILEGYGCGYSCSIETVMKNLLYQNLETLF